MKPTNILKLNSGPFGANQAAVVFVHGFSGDLVKTWREIPKFLQNSKRLRDWDFLTFGYQTRKRFDVLGLWSADANLEEIATKLYSTPEIGKKNYTAVAFVAHSMGGLVVQRALLRYADLRKRTTHVLLFGTPSNGLEKAALFSWVKQQIRNMKADGEFIKQLRKEWQRLKLDSNPPFRFLTIAGESDQFVPPESSLGPFPETVRRVIPGNHLSMLDAQASSAPAVQLIVEALTNGAANGDPRNSARVAVEAGEFQDAIERLWPARDQLDDGGAVQLAIALDRTGRRQDAIDLLQAHKPEGTDVLGVLAGRLKRRWLVTRERADFQAALDLYRRGYEEATAKSPIDHDQAHYHGINLAYLALAGSTRNDQAARDMAEKVLIHTKSASDPTQLRWRLGSEGDALIILGRAEDALDCHRRAAGTEGLKPWEALSIEEQSLRTADLCRFTRAQARQLAEIYEGAE